MKIHQILSKPKLGMKNNQDSVGVSKKKSGIWVIDGITEISPIQLTSGSKSVSWFVNQLSEYLTQYLDQIDFTITEILVNAVKKIRKEFKALKPSNIDLSNLYEQPSASIIVARNNQDKGLELFSLGDCVVYLHSSNQEYLIQNEELKKTEEQFQAEIFSKKIKYPELTHSEFLKRIKIYQLLKQLRNELTQNNHYHILNLDSNMISKGHESYFHSIKTVLLMSDGFSRVIDTYHLFEDYSGFILNLEKQGVDKIYDKMRDIEQQDINVLDYQFLMMLR